MTRIFTALTGGLCCLCVFSMQPAIADDDDTKAAVAAAAIVLGVAAIAHNEHHHHNNKHSSDAKHEAEYERGYNDALYNSNYDTRNNSEYYNDGYNAGVYERNHRVNHYRGHRGDQNHNNKSRHGAPSLAQRACVGEASARWGVNPRDIHPVKSKKVGGDDYYVEVASGYRHGKCEVSGDGDVYLLEDGRL